MKSPFWVNDVYSLGYWLKDYGFYSQKLPLYSFMDHGLTLFDNILPYELENDSPLIFKFSPRLVNEYKKVSKKPVYCLLNPNIYYRIKNKIEQTNEAKGTLFFVAHSTPDIDDNTNWDEFIVNMENIPEQYKPIDICLHHHDIVKGLDLVFKNKGFIVVTAGSPYDNSYIQKFYSILRNYKYTMSNLIGSYTFYSVEFGIPFSLYGQEPQYFNKGDINLEKGNYISYKKQLTYQKALELFMGFHNNITPEQNNFVNFELGKYHSISRIKTAYLLYKTFFIYMFRKIRRVLFRGLRQSYIKIKKYASFGFYLFKQVLFQKQLEEKILIQKGYVTLKDVFNLNYNNRTTSVLLKNNIYITDSFWYLHSLKEIFANEVYRFITTNSTPYILDCGANIGLSVIYFKRLFPKAKIIAFEPDTNIFTLLQNNLQTFEYSDVIIENKAIWIEDTILNFSATGSLGGKINEIPDVNEKDIQVLAVRLRNYLNEPVDFLKIDIEGPEVKVLNDCFDLLINVKNLFVEYHSDPNKDQELNQLLSILKEAGFRVYIKEAWNNLPLPFLNNDYKPYYDLQLNIFAYRVNNL